MTKQDVGQSEYSDGSGGDSAVGPVRFGSIVFGTLAGISVSSFLSPFSHVRNMAGGYEYIASLVVGAIAGALVAILCERMNIPKFNGICLTIIVFYGSWLLLMPSVG